ncbi:hypothetical protein HHK36_023102 [Tetracentron sinense]|uniref:Uncharacterized protein n=1 Tax=Tetracentron sinense TaxID=13715 RepID=A0A834YUA7_TETSI|nr:hypothetical protein HHK36_023102 [Tetracentron sinense]
MEEDNERLTKHFLLTTQKSSFLHFLKATMASDDTMSIYSSIYESELDIDDDDHHHQPHNLSRLSMCTSSSKHSMSGDQDDDGEELSMYMSSLSIGGSGVSSDSDKEPGCYSLPVTPTRRRFRSGCANELIGVREYGSENEAHERGIGHKTRRKMVCERWVEKKKKDKAPQDDEEEMVHANLSECVVMTRPKGGKRSLCMDLDEVKACRDLGFELENQRMFEIPISISGSTLDTSSGGNSPISN